MFTLISRGFMKSYDEKGNLQLPKWKTMICISIVATIFFLVGLFQTIVAVVFVEASRRNPILVMGPLFMGIGILLLISVCEMCVLRRKKQAINDPILEEMDEGPGEDPGNFHVEGTNTIILRADQLPAMVMLSPEDILRLGPEQKRLLLAQPAMPPVDICSPAPAYYTGNSRLPQVALYDPPEDGEPLPVPLFTPPAEQNMQLNATAPALPGEVLPQASENLKEPVMTQAQDEISKEIMNILGPESLQTPDEAGAAAGGNA